MATEVKLPELGDGIESGDVLEIFVSVGDVISKGQDIVEMETDKATVPVPSSVGGKVTKILVNEGDSLAIGGVILEVEAAAEAAAPEAPAAAPKPEAKPEPKAEPKAETPAPAAPDETPAAAPKPAPPQPQAPVPAQPAAAPVATTAPGEVIPAGPAIRRFAREVGVDLASVQGSGDSGRITRDDVLAVVRTANQAARSGGSAPATTSPSAASSPAPATSKTSSAPGTASSDDFGSVHVERMSKIRKTIGRQMHASWSTVPRVTNFDDADITDLERLRQSSKDDYAAQGLKLTTMPFLIKAVATALRHHPSINAVIDEENEQIIYKDYVNVGIAVDTDRGLVVPVMQNTDQRGIPEIARGLAEMAGKVRGGQFAVSDLRGGTFTISNLGAIGGQYSTPIVNVPEVAILLVGRSRKMPVVMPDDSIKPRLMMPLSLSYDHRLVDGGTAARFLNDVIGYLEAPSRLLLAL
ncbi:2-oxo acid dehydrogenase subunit E2 [Novipirellula sp. SH528]|uniref:2-oxo acid dehydrogenase subunit E2 n=1 Tax=Novipirellula sp. SH528 TaxID=3454466 RepID=UPI003F9FBC9C